MKEGHRKCTPIRGRRIPDVIIKSGAACHNGVSAAITGFFFPRSIPFRPREDNVTGAHRRAHVQLMNGRGVGDQDTDNHGTEVLETVSGSPRGMPREDAAPTLPGALRTHLRPQRLIQTTVTLGGFLQPGSTQPGSTQPAARPAEQPPQTALMMASGALGGLGKCSLLSPQLPSGTGSGCPS